MVPLNTSGHSSEPKTSFGDVYRHFFEEIHKPLYTNLRAEKHARHTFLRINRSNGHVNNDHLQANNSRVSRAQWRTRHVLRYVITKTHAQIKIKSWFFLPDTLAVPLFSYSFAFSFCNLQLSYLRIYFKAYAYLWTLLWPDVLSAADWWQILHGSSLHFMVI